MLTNNYELPPQRLGNLLDVEKRVDFVRASKHPLNLQSSSGDPDDIPERASGNETETSSSWEYGQILEAYRKDDPKVVKKEKVIKEEWNDVITLDDDDDVKPEIHISPLTGNFTSRDLNKYLKAAKEGDLKEIQNFFGIIPIDTTDFYGWTATMCAAAEGHFEMCKLLLEKGADPGIRDRNGLGLLDIARQNRQKEFIAKIMDYYCKTSQPSTSSAPIEMKYCNCCEVFIEKNKEAEHISSITHQLNDEKMRGAAPQSGIQLGPSNVGYRLMCASGWSEEQGLGRNSDGHRFPIRTILKRNRTGLGMEQPPKKITHFGPFDKNAIRVEKKISVVTKKELVQKMKKEDRITKKFRADFSDSDNVYDYFHGK